MPRIVLLVVFLASVLPILNACSVVDERKAAYKDAESTAALEIPPDLLSMEAGDELAVALAPLGGSVTLSEFNRVQPKENKQKQLTPIGINLSGEFRLERDGAEQWLVVKGTPAQWWDEVKLFWSQRNVKIEREDLLLGVIQTEWIKDDRTTMASFLKKTFSALYDSGNRDQYTIRFEAGVEEGTTDIYVTHRGMREEALGEQVRWMPRPSENELEVEIVKQLAIQISKDESLAEAMVGGRPVSVILARLVESDGSAVSLRVILPFAKTWRRVGNALVQLDLSIDDFNRKAGLIEITGVMAKREKKKSLSERLFGPVDPEEDKFNLKLKEDDSEVLITMLDKNTGEQIDTPDSKYFFEQLAILLNRG